MAEWSGPHEIQVAEIVRYKRLLSDTEGSREHCHDVSPSDNVSRVSQHTFRHKFDMYLHQTVDQREVDGTILLHRLQDMDCAGSSIDRLKVVAVVMPRVQYYDNILDRAFSAKERRIYNLTDSEDNISDYIGVSTSLIGQLLSIQQI